MLMNTNIITDYSDVLARSACLFNYKVAYKKKGKDKIVLSVEQKTTKQFVQIKIEKNICLVSIESGVKKLMQSKSSVLQKVSEFELSLVALDFLLFSQKTVKNLELWISALHTCLSDDDFSFLDYIIGILDYSVGKNNILFAVDNFQYDNYSLSMKKGMDFIQKILWVNRNDPCVKKFLKDGAIPFISHQDEERSTGKPAGEFMIDVIPLYGKISCVENFLNNGKVPSLTNHRWVDLIAKPMGDFTNSVTPLFKELRDDMQ